MPVTCGLKPSRVGMSVPPPLPTAKRGWRHRLGWSAALAVLGAGATVLYHADPYAEDSLLPACPFHAVTGLYCPGCGMTRCLHAVLHLDVGAAMAAEGRNFLFFAPHIVAIPSLAIFGIVLAFNVLGDALRDALDPRLRV